MAFTVTPTSGEGPYAFQADIVNNFLIDGINYTASVMTSDQVGSCPVVGATSGLSPTNVAKLVNGEVVVSGAPSVPSGSCRASTLAIKRVSDDVVIASSSVQIDNV